MIHTEIACGSYGLTDSATTHAVDLVTHVLLGASANKHPKHFLVVRLPHRFQGFVARQPPMQLCPVPAGPSTADTRRSVPGTTAPLYDPLQNGQSGTFASSE